MKECFGMQIMHKTSIGSMASCTTIAPLILKMIKDSVSHNCHSVESKSEKIVVKQRRSRGLSTSEGLVQECFDEC